MRLVIDPLQAARRRAEVRIAQAFNNRALQSLHADMVALSQGDATAIAEREDERSELMRCVEDAATLREIEEITP